MKFTNKTMSAFEDPQALYAAMANLYEPKKDKVNRKRLEQEEFLRQQHEALTRQHEAALREAKRKEALDKKRQSK